jgi:hypothetical protein
MYLDDKKTIQCVCSDLIFALLSFDSITAENVVARFAPSAHNAVAPFREWDLNMKFACVMFVMPKLQLKSE